MYEYFHGTLVGRESDAVVVDVGGIGFRLACSSSTLAKLAPEGPVRVHAHLVVRDDRHELYGFAEPSERHLFRQLLQVSGVGPSVALGLLSAYEATALASHIAAGEIALLTRAKGIGKRTAERIVVELRDRVAKDAQNAKDAPGGRPAVRAPLHTDAVLALCSLGLPRADAERRVAALEVDGMDLETIVKHALR